MKARLTRVVGQAAGLAVKAEPPLPPGLDAATHLHQGPAAAAPRHLEVRTAFGVVAPAFQVLPEIQDPGARTAVWGHGMERPVIFHYQTLDGSRNYRQQFPKRHSRFGDRPERLIGSEFSVLMGELDHQSPKLSLSQPPFPLRLWPEALKNSHTA